MQPRDFFDQVNLALDVEPPTRNVYEVSLLIARDQPEAETGQDTVDFTIADLFAEDSFDFTAVRFVGRQIELARDHVNHATNQFASGVEDQLCHSISRWHGRFEIRTTFEAMRRVGMNPVALRHAAYRHRIPPSRLDQDIPCLVGDHGVVAAHDAGEADWLLCVSDYQILGRERAFNTVESLQSFTSLRLAD